MKRARGPVHAWQAWLASRASNLGEFTREVLRSFRANQGLLLAGAIAYYTLLSLVPLLILILIALSNVYPAGEILATLADYLEFLIAGQADTLVDQLRVFLDHREAIGGAMLVTMLVFSALAFTVLENAMSVIFVHRVVIRRRHFLLSAVLPYAFILFLGVGLLVATVVSGKLALLAAREVAVFGVPRSLDALSHYLWYLTGVAGEIMVLTAIYLVLPVGPGSWRHALVGALTAGVLWELSRHALVWYYATVSQVQVVYGTLATAIVLLLTVEVAAVFLLLGAQVVASLEHRARRGASAPADRGSLRVEVPAGSR